MFNGGKLNSAYRYREFLNTGSIVIIETSLECCSGRAGGRAAGLKCERVKVGRVSRVECVGVYKSITRWGLAESFPAIITCWQEGGFLLRKLRFGL